MAKNLKKTVKRKKTVFSSEDKKYLRLIAKRITQAREETGLDKQALADATKLSRMEIFRIEKAEVSIPILTLKKISQVLQISLSELVELKNK